MSLYQDTSEYTAYLRLSCQYCVVLPDTRTITLTFQLLYVFVRLRLQFCLDTDGGCRILEIINVVVYALFPLAFH